MTIGTGHATGRAIGLPTAGFPKAGLPTAGLPVGGPHRRPRAAAPGLGRTRLFVLVLLATLASQMSLPAVHAWRSTEASVGSARDLGAEAPVAAGENERGLDPAFSRATPHSDDHDPATCMVCRLLHDVGRTAPTQAVFAVPVSAGASMLAAWTPRAPARHIRGDHPPRAPPA